MNVLSCLCAIVSLSSAVLAVTLMMNNIRIRPNQMKIMSKLEAKGPKIMSEFFDIYVYI